MDKEAKTKKTIIRRTDAQIAAELQRKLTGLKTKIEGRKRREDTLRKILLGAGLLALGDASIIAKVKEKLSERDRKRFQEIGDIALLPEGSSESQAISGATGGSSTPDAIHPSENVTGDGSAEDEQPVGALMQPSRGEAA